MLGSAMEGCKGCARGVIRLWSQCTCVRVSELEGVCKAAQSTAHLACGANRLPAVAAHPYVCGARADRLWCGSHSPCRCHGLLRVNVYKDAVKNASFPSMPNTRQLAASLAPFHASLREAAALAVERPVHVITPDEEEAARGFLGVMHDYLSKLCGDLRLHTIVNVGMSKRTGVFMKESLLESLPLKDRGFMRAFMDTQMFAAYCDGVISDYCEA